MRRQAVVVETVLPTAVALAQGDKTTRVNDGGGQQGDHRLLGRATGGLRREQVGARCGTRFVAGGGDQLVKRGYVAGDQPLDEQLLGREVVEQSTLADPGLSSHGCDRDPVSAITHQDTSGRVEYALSRLPCTIACHNAPSRTILPLTVPDALRLQTGRPVQYSAVMHWWFLAGAIGAEVFATSCLRAATRAESAWIWWALVIGGYLAAFGLFFAALSHGAPLAAAYATWSGVGVALTAVVAWLVFAERLTLGALAGIALVVAGVVLIEWCGHPHEAAA